MSYVHSKNTVIKVATKDISAYTSTSELPLTADSHDVTGYGNDSHRKEGGLLDGTFTCSGTYDNTAVTGPGAVLKPLRGTVVAIIRRPKAPGPGSRRTRSTRS